MYQKLLLLSIALFSLLGCNETPSDNASQSQQPKLQKIGKEEQTSPPKEGFKLKEGIYIERPSPEALQSETPYNFDNQIYTGGKTFVYDYVMTRKNGQVVTCKIVEQKDIPMRKAWTYFPYDERDETCIKEHQIQVLEGEHPMIKYLPRKDLTYANFESHTPKETVQGAVMQGLVENEANIYVPNPSGRIFNLTQSAPHLLVQKPLEVGKEWTWVNKVPSKYSDPRWGDWQADEEMRFNYKISAKTSLDTPFGLLDCWEIKASGSGLIGSSALTAYFNEKYGFVQMTYKNIDQSTMVMKLTAVNKTEKKQG